ncbi:hypothetical protein FF38_09583 [Lucilia cuprina]|uniref:Uncharacterized protein n=1 Tax=Lucilia cuprina TaxID=7375 RepID=A0A0L0C4V9_LUCCU|nr:hypothetical protein FF38_09583 [Lucilia cuprina]
MVMSLETSSSIECYVCEDKKSCKNPKKLECNPMLAKNTLTYLMAFHKGVNATANKYYYKGCTYSNIEGCKLPLNEFLTSSLLKQECYQCRDKNGCNPAGRVNIELMSVFATTVIAISIKCYVCDDKKSCKRPSLKECNPKLANRTRTYIFAFHKDASTNATSTVYECFQEYIETPSTDYYYKGCTYANIKGCELPLDNVFENCKRECNQCNDKNGCNPAGHFQIEFMTLIATILMGFHLRSGPHPNKTSPFYECFSEYIQTTTGDYYYKNCVYSNVNVCGTPYSPYISPIIKKPYCKQCNTNGCNPADRVGINIFNKPDSSQKLFILLAPIYGFSITIWF